MTNEFRKMIRPLVVLFIMATALLLALRGRLAEWKVDIEVVIIANILLLVVTMLNLYFQFKNINHPNPNAMVRGVIGATFLKLFGLGAAVLIYLFAAGESRSVNAVFFSMGLYILYTWLEVRISLRLNPKK